MKVVVRQIQKHAEKHIIYLDVVDGEEVLLSKSIAFNGDDLEFSEKLNSKLDDEVSKIIKEKKELDIAAAKVQSIIDTYNKEISMKEER